MISIGDEMPIGRPPGEPGATRLTHVLRVGESVCTFVRAAERALAGARR